MFAHFMRIMIEYHAHPIMMGLYLYIHHKQYSFSASASASHFTLVSRAGFVERMKEQICFLIIFQFVHFM